MITTNVCSSSIICEISLFASVIRQLLTFCKWSHGRPSKFFQEGPNHNCHGYAVELLITIVKLIFCWAVNAQTDKSKCTSQKDKSEAQFSYIIASLQNKVIQSKLALEESITSNAISLSVMKKDMKQKCESFERRINDLKSISEEC